MTVESFGAVAKGFNDIPLKSVMVKQYNDACILMLNDL